MLTKKLNVSEDEISVLMDLLQEERIVTKKYTFQCPKCYEMNTVIDSEINMEETCQICGSNIPVRNLIEGATITYALDKNDWKEYLEENDIRVIDAKQQETSTIISFPEVKETKKESVSMEEKKMPEDKKIQLFISHSSDDIKYIDCFVKFLEELGFDDENMFCSSVDGYGIPWGADIYDYLEKKFNNTNNELFVLFMLSDNYYASPACLNEMGAAWVLKKDYRSILLPGFEFEEIDGAIDPRKVAIKLDDKKLRMKLNDVKKQLSELFGLDGVKDTKWDKIRETLIEKIEEINEEEKN